MSSSVSERRKVSTAGRIRRVVIDRAPPEGVNLHALLYGQTKKKVTNFTRMLIKEK
jgi:hypothetical protein